MNQLQKALTLNALFSSLSGLILILFNQQIAEIFGTSNTTVFWIVGLILLYFSVTIFYERIKQRKPFVLWIIIQDISWVLGSVLILILKPFNISSTGNLIILIIALIVLFMAVNQSIKLKKRNQN
ncbi:hypothetical protein [Crocinitomix catalasitica]|uniref:hypothetical protein n=1 Tax=Crocinitomix catalasitica TaxID=184607 RepID=UPI000480F5FF|nr:hypothetical protein [Crocinitomix catalasitica]